ncbi:MAG: hypothetical protein HYY06_00540 [Deltaproteobacteria bacterium]|nr:hypothetical protein [Deltaproteobacteria bacterium]
MRILLVTLALVVGCGDDDAGPDGDADADSDADSDADGDAGWTIEELDGDDAAQQTSLAVATSGEIGIGYFPLRQREVGPCLADGAGQALGADIRWVQGTPGSMSATEVVGTPSFFAGPAGMTVRWSGAVPYVATLGGDLDPAWENYCGSSDMVLYSKAGGGWQMETVASSSGDAPPTDGCDIDGASTFGWVVGNWGALAVDGGGQMAMAWRDLHSGGMLQRDDAARADLELATGGPGAWAYGMIDCGLGAGDYTSLAFEPGGGLVAAWYNPMSTGVGDQAREGVWIGRRSDPEWDRFRLFRGEAGPGIGMAVAPDGTIGVSWYQEQSLRYAQIGPGQSLDSAHNVLASDVSSDAGRYSSLAFLADGRPVIAHYRCKRYDEDDASCEAAYDAPVLSYPVAGIDQPWRSEVIDSSGDGNCGADTQVGVLHDGRVVVAYTCVAYDADSGEFVGALKLATRGAP